MAVEITRMDVSAAEPRLTAEQEAELARWVRTGPDVERDGVVRWRLVDLLERVAREFGVSFHDRSIGKLLCRLGFRHLSVRSRHPEADPEAQETHKKSSRRWSLQRFQMSLANGRSNSGGKMRPASVDRADRPTFGRSMAADRECCATPL